MISVMVEERKPRGRGYSETDKEVLRQTTITRLDGNYHRITYRDRSGIVWGKPSKWELLNYVKGQLRGGTK